jgi:hypothetical protein
MLEQREDTLSLAAKPACTRVLSAATITADKRAAFRRAEAPVSAEATPVVAADTVAADITNRTLLVSAG